MNLIGNTPLIKINYKYNGVDKFVYTKLEYYNLTGSIKDRVVDYILNKDIKENKLKSDMILVEATSGNTGISLSAIGATTKHKVHIFMPDWVSKERLGLMKLYGADVTLVKRSEGGFKKCIEKAYEFAKNNNGYLLNQFNNLNNVEAHFETTGKEITDKIKVDAFVSGIGTGGTLIGVAKRLKLENEFVKIFALEPKNMSLIKNKTKDIKEHKIEGIGDDFIPSIVDLKLIDDCILITDEEAILMAQKISKELGIGVGISSGANMMAAIKLKNLGYNNVVTIFPDDSKKYLSTDLTNEYYNNLNNIELLNYEII